MSLRALPWLSVACMLGCLLILAAHQVSGGTSLDDELLSSRDALLQMGLAEEQLAAASRAAARQRRQAAGPTVTATVVAAAALSDEPGLPADNSTTTPGGLESSSGSNSTSNGTSNSTGSIPRSSSNTAVWNSTINPNSTINSKAGIKYVLLNQALAAARCVAACPEFIGASRWQVLAAMNGPLGAAPSKPLQLHSFKVVTVHGVCRFYERDSQGLVRSYFGNEVVVNDPASPSNTTMCMYTNDAGQTRGGPRSAGYLCTCQNACGLPASASKADSSCEQQSYWGGKKCPVGCNPCRCRIKRNGVFFVGYDVKGKCFTPGGIGRAFDYSILTCH